MWIGLDETLRRCFLRLARMQWTNLLESHAELGAIAERIECRPIPPTDSDNLRAKGEWAHYILCGDRSNDCLPRFKREEFTKQIRKWQFLLHPDRLFRPMPEADRVFKLMDPLKTIMGEYFESRRTNGDRPTNREALPRYTWSTPPFSGPTPSAPPPPRSTSFQYTRPSAPQYARSPPPPSPSTSASESVPSPPPRTASFWDRLFPSSN